MLKDRTEAADRILHLADGEEVGTAETVVVRDDRGSLAVVPRAEADPARIVRHDVSAHDPSAAFALSRLDSPDLGHVPMGIFRNVQRPTYDDSLREQIASARTGEVTDADIDALLAGRDTWTVGA